jgi:hypothetical protein
MMRSGGYPVDHEREGEDNTNSENERRRDQEQRMLPGLRGCVRDH